MSSLNSAPSLIFYTLFTCFVSAAKLGISSELVKRLTNFIFKPSLYNF
ncbi:hypothetical protein M089_4179 [Bacteroides ovatus str. 3725 D9 iii]|nr:hypothetical protein M088_2771 [Bacteroides ovatus str. 3725 D1 iv]KDS18777.1 hypothetical protein M082_3237 [Bacteroides fragilis str. 3725 D9 ii]KDS26982.1 hypothetical protein M089_4179 [Bacteroides ovatus str. 3725 D9 iii]